MEHHHGRNRGGSNGGGISTNSGAMGGSDAFESFGGQAALSVSLSASYTGNSVAMPEHTFRSSLYKPRRALTTGKSAASLPFGDASSPEVAHPVLPRLIGSLRRDDDMQGFGSVSPLVSSSPDSQASQRMSPDEAALSMSPSTTGFVISGGEDDISPLDRVVPRQPISPQPRAESRVRQGFLSTSLPSSFSPLKREGFGQAEDGSSAPPNSLNSSLAASPSQAARMVFFRRQRQRQNQLKPPPRASSRLSSSLCSEDLSHQHRAILTIDENMAIQYSGCDMDDPTVLGMVPRPQKNNSAWLVSDVIAALESLRHLLEQQDSRTDSWSPQFRALVTGALDDDLSAMDFDFDRDNLDEECPTATVDFIRNLLSPAELRLFEKYLKSDSGRKSRAKDDGSPDNEDSSKTSGSAETSFADLDLDLLAAKLQNLAGQN